MSFEKRQLQRGLSPVASSLKGLIRPLFKRMGYQDESLFYDWPLLVGAKWGQSSTPGKIYFPKGQRTGGTLNILCIDQSVAFLMKYAETQIIDKVNQYFGYSAISKITFRPQETSSFKTENVPSLKKQKLVEIPSEIQESLSQIEDVDLRERLRLLAISFYQDKAA